MDADLLLDPLAPPKNCPQCARVGIKSKVKKMKVGPTSADLILMTILSVLSHSQLGHPRRSLSVRRIYLSWQTTYLKQQKN